MLTGNERIIDHVYQVAFLRKCDTIKAIAEKNENRCYSNITQQKSQVFAVLGFFYAIYKAGLNLRLVVVVLSV